LATDILISGDSWHPLDRRPAPEFIPPVWIGVHVSVRLVAALHTLRLLPSPRGPRPYGNAWPAHLVEYCELAQYADDPIWKAERAAEGNRIRPRPSATDISRMEVCLIWPARYLRETPDLLRAVGAAALARSLHRDLHRVARRLRLAPRVLRQRNRNGLDLIAAGLRRDDVPVF
jgi:hypothetical protein